LVVAHVVHDLRPARVALADRDSARGLAERLGLAWDESSVRVRARAGNAEALARDARYDELVRMAREHECASVATAHQGDDLVETFLMRVLRGAGPRGLACMSPERILARGVRLIRPMLRVVREDSERLCAHARWDWREDATNADATRVRARLRRDVLPVLRELTPDLHLRIGGCVDVLEGWARIVDGAVDGAGARLSPDAGAVEVVFERARARAMDPMLLGEIVRACVARGGGALDRLSHETIVRVCGLVRGKQLHARCVRLPGLDVRVTAREVRLVPGTGQRSSGSRGATSS
jgi:tRNA(Ile)-lysidine synthase